MLTEVILLFDTGRLCLSSHGPEAVGPAGEGLSYIRKIYRNWGGVWDQKGTTAGFIPSVPHRQRARESGEHRRYPRCVQLWMGMRCLG